MSIFYHTNNLFPDTGIYTIMAMQAREKPEDVSKDDLDEVAAYLSELYCEPHYKSIQNYISSIFLNSTFVQHSKSVEEKYQYAKEVLYAFENEPLDDQTRCVFFPDKPAVMWAHRQHIPLL